MLFIRCTLVVTILCCVVKSCLGAVGGMVGAIGVVGYVYRCVAKTNVVSNVDRASSCRSSVVTILRCAVRGCAGASGVVVGVVGVVDCICKCIVVAILVNGVGCA